MAKITHRYDLPDYAAFMNMGFELKLPDDVIKSVSDLADLVGAPTYIKTPVFPVRDPSEFRSGSSLALLSSNANGGGSATAYHVAGSSANSFQNRFGTSSIVGGGSMLSSSIGGTHAITRTNSTHPRNQQIRHVYK